MKIGFAEGAMEVAVFDMKKKSLTVKASLVTYTTCRVYIQMTIRRNAGSSSIRASTPSSSSGAWEAWVERLLQKKELRTA